jgi:hypothetical protein
MADPIAVDYELTPDDLNAFQLRAIQRSPSAKRTRRNTYIYLFAGVLLLAIVPAIGPGGFDISRVSFGFLVGFFALVASLTWFFEKRLTRRAISDLVKEEKPDKGQLGRHTLRLDDAGMVESTAVGESRTSWAGVDRVEKDPDYIFIYTAPHAALVIPRHAFSSADESEKFFQFAAASRSGVTGRDA